MTTTKPIRHTQTSSTRAALIESVHRASRELAEATALYTEETVPVSGRAQQELTRRLRDAREKYDAALAALQTSKRGPARRIR